MTTLREATCFVYCPQMGGTYPLPGGDWRAAWATDVVDLVGAVRDAVCAFDDGASLEEMLRHEARVDLLSKRLAAHLALIRGIRELDAEVIAIDQRRRP